MQLRVYGGSGFSLPAEVLRALLLVQKSTAGYRVPKPKPRLQTPTDESRPQTLKPEHSTHLHCPPLGPFKPTCTFWVTQHQGGSENRGALFGGVFEGIVCYLGYKGVPLFWETPIRAWTARAAVRRRSRSETRNIRMTPRHRKHPSLLKPK